MAQPFEIRNTLGEWRGGHAKGEAVAKSLKSSLCRSRLISPDDAAWPDRAFIADRAKVFRWRGTPSPVIRFALQEDGGVFQDEGDGVCDAGDGIAEGAVWTLG